MFGSIPCVINYIYVTTHRPLIRKNVFPNSLWKVSGETTKKATHDALLLCNFDFLRISIRHLSWTSMWNSSFG